MSQSDDSMQPKSTRLFQISEPDLADLESLVPRLVDMLYRPELDNQTRIKIRRVQQIIVNIRWNYGPPSEVIVIPDGEHP